MLCSGKKYGTGEKNGINTLIKRIDANRHLYRKNKLLYHNPSLIQKFINTAMDFKISVNIFVNSRVL